MSITLHNYIRLLSKLRLTVKIALFGIFFVKFFDHVLTHALKISQKICSKIANFSHQSEFRKKSIVYLLLLATPLFARANDGIVGFWKTIDEKTNRAQSVVAVYDYQGKYYGRLIVTFNDDGSFNDTTDTPRERAPGVIGNPYYAGLDIIWGLKKQGNKYNDGHILDPEKGRIYGAELWREGNDLIVRGKLLMFGRNQVWPPATEADFPPGFQKPNLATLIPVIPRVR